MWRALRLDIWAMSHGAISNAAAAPLPVCTRTTPWAALSPHPTPPRSPFASCVLCTSCFFAALPLSPLALILPTCRAGVGVEERFVVGGDGRLTGPELVDWVVGQCTAQLGGRVSCVVLACPGTVGVGKILLERGLVPQVHCFGACAPSVPDTFVRGGDIVRGQVHVVVPCCLSLLLLELGRPPHASACTHSSPIHAALLRVCR